MAHHSSETTLSPAEREFMDFMQRGDDFFKIELLRPAKSWYIKALAMNIETEKVRKKIAACNEQLAFEIKVIKILTAIVVITVLGFILF
ncbi:MAG TPA: hypothetical protein VIN10_10865 [Bacteroidales bacterium]